MATTQNSAQARGIVVTLEGNARLVDAAGNRRLLKVGDECFRQLYPIRGIDGPGLWEFGCGSV